MSLERTLALIKPDAVEAGTYGEILSLCAKTPLKIVAIKKVHLTPAEAEEFYSDHKGKFFFERLTEFISSAPLFSIVLEGEDAISVWRERMGATNFEDAEEGTVRKLFATSLTKNAVHGSDSPENAKKEISFFFSQLELIR